MKFKQLAARFGFIYLVLVPFLTAVIGFGLGHSSYSVYLPVWMVHCCIMIAAISLLGLPAIMGMDREKQQLLMVALLLIVPWMFMAVFAGMGPPPRVAAEWVKSSFEQETRYLILTVAGISVTLGLSLLREKLRIAGESFYSQAGLTAMLIAIPFFIINMTFLGSFLAEILPHFAATPGAVRPDWYLAIRAQFVPESAVQVSMTYVASAAFAVSLHRAGWFRRSSRNIYLGFSVAGFVLSLMPASVPDALAIPSYVVSVPAITFIMPYLIGLQLLRRAGSQALPL